jgi:Domain of unknown function (DUF4352)
MLSAKSGRLLQPAAVSLLLFALIGVACSDTRNASFIGTFRMGEKVQVGSLTYQVLEASWRNELGPGGRSPKDRFLFVRLTVSNASGESMVVPAMTLEGAGQTYPEATEGMDKVHDWLGLIRDVGGSETDQGWVVFDAPIAAYKLVVSEPGVPDEQNHAHVEIPVNLD